MLINLKKLGSAGGRKEEEPQSQSRRQIKGSGDGKQRANNLMMEVGFQEPEGFLIDDPRRKDSREFRVKESQWLPVSVWNKAIVVKVLGWTFQQHHEQKLVSGTMMMMMMMMNQSPPPHPPNTPHPITAKTNQPLLGPPNPLGKKHCGDQMVLH